MGHNITAIIIKGNYDQEKAKEYDLRGVDLKYNLTMFLIDIYYVAYWQHSLELKTHLKFSPSSDLTIPTESVIAHIIKEITKQTNPIFALIHTEYFGGVGDQFANIFEGISSVNEEMKTINEALQHLGVRAEEGSDEFDSVGLADYRSTPSHLEKYWDLCEGLGL